MTKEKFGFWDNIKKGEELARKEMEKRQEEAKKKEGQKK